MHGYLYITVHIYVCMCIIIIEFVVPIATGSKRPRFDSNINGNTYEY